MNTCLTLCVAAILGMASSTAIAGTMSFTEETEPFVNPGQGWTSYGNWDRVTNYVNVGCGYFRFQWQQLNPAEDVYDWRVLEKEIDFYARKGLPFTFRVMTCSRNGGRKSLVPAWVWKKGAKYKAYQGEKYVSRQGETNEMWCPVWSDKIFLASHEKFIRALAAKYDGDPRILYIDIGSYGNWGEWHCWRLGSDGVSNRDYGADDETKWCIMQPYIESFRKTPLVAMTDDVPTLVRLFKGSDGNPPAGLRRDGIGLPGLFKRWGKGKSPYNDVEGMDDVWKKKPIAFEWLQPLSRLIRPGDKAFEKGQKMDDIGFAVRWMLDRHVSTVNSVPFLPWQLDDHPEKKEDIRQIDLFAGARLVPVSAEVGRMSDGRVMVSIKGVNKGVAPIYAPFRLALCVKSVGWERDFDTDLSACQPGPFTFKGEFRDVPQGVLSLRIRHAAGIWHDFRFAAKELDGDGSLPIRNVEFDVRYFGARGDGSTKDTAAIQRAIDNAADCGGGTVRLGRGTYLTGSLYLKSNVTLFLDDGSTLKGSPNREDYNALDVCPQNSSSKAESSSGAHLLLCIEQTNVTVRGTGRIDGNCTAFLLGPDGRPWPGGQSRIPWRPSQMLYFVESANVTVEGVALEDAPYWSCFFHGCTNVVARSLRVRTRRVPFHTHNGDGIDIDCCEEVEVSGCDIDTADDAITLRGNVARLKTPRPCAGVRVSDCRLSSACNAIRLGVGDGVVRDASFRDIVIRDTRTAVDVVSSWRRGGTGVMFQDIDFDGLDVDSVLLCRVSPSFAKETRIDGIRFANVKGRVECPSWITGRKDSPVGCVAFDNVSLRHGVVCLNAPEVRIVGGNFACIEPTELERLTWNRKIDERDDFPCVFSGPLYDSIQSRRLRFGE